MTVINNNKGFTLIELMIVAAISGIVISGIVMVFRAQNRSFLMQEQVTTVQQNLRAGAYVMSTEIRMAGCDPSGGTAVTILAAGDGDVGNPFRFSCISDSDNLDNDGDAAIDENNEIKTVEYGLFDDQGDGDFELGRQEIGSGNPQVSIAENIQAIGFAYSYDSNDPDNEMDTYPVDTDGDGTMDSNEVIWAVSNGATWVNLDINSDGVIDDNDSNNPGLRANGNLAGVSTGVTVDLTRIGGVKIWMLAASDTLDADNRSRYFNNHIYIVGNRKIYGNDSLIRRILSTNVKCRNMAL